MLLVSDLALALAGHPDLYAAIETTQLTTFLEVVERCLPVIELSCPRSRSSLPPLPNNVRDLLVQQLSVPRPLVESLWEALGPIIMAGRRLTTTADDIDKSLSKAASSFDLGAKPDCVTSRRIGSPLLSGVGAEVIVPPVRSCITPDCPQQGKPLGGHKHHYAATLYTRSRGTLPVRVYSLYCKGASAHSQPSQL